MENKKNKQNLFKPFVWKVQITTKIIGNPQLYLISLSEKKKKNKYKKKETK